MTVVFVGRLDIELAWTMLEQPFNEAVEGLSEVKTG